MNSDKEKWDRKYQSYTISRDPDDLLVEKLGFLVEGSVLDVACGDGRHAIFLAEKGFSVHGLDISGVGLSMLSKISEEKGLDIKTTEIDLDGSERWDLVPETDNILISYFKPTEAVFEKLVEKLRASGRLMFFTFNTSHHEKTGFPLEFCVDESFRKSFDQLEVVEYNRSGSVDFYVLEKK